MDKQIKEEWIKELSSRSRFKGKGYLRSPFYLSSDPKTPKFKECCLGVLCDIMYKKGKGFWGPTEDCYYEYNHTISRVSTPGPLQLELGISDIEVNDLINLNDDNGTWKPVIEYIKQKM